MNQNIIKSTVFFTATSETTNVFVIARFEVKHAWIKLVAFDLISLYKYSTKHC